MSCIAVATVVLKGSELANTVANISLSTVTLTLVSEQTCPTLITLAPTVSTRVGKMEEQIAALKSQLEAQNVATDQKFEELKQMMQSLSIGTYVTKHDERIPPPRFGYNPKLEFPKFDGSNARLWIKKCCKYFSLCKIPDDQKVDLASLYMLDKAENWVSSYLATRSNVDWHDFVIDLAARFRDDKGINVVEEFNKLQQHDSIENYVDDFENLRSIMVQVGYMLPDKYLLESFIGGLKSSLRPFVKAFKPQTISAAIEYARFQQESDSLNTSNRPKYTTTKPYQTLSTQNSSKPPLLPLPPTSPFLKTNTKPTPKTKFILADVRAEKIAKGLCYYYDAPYNRNHQCQFKEPQLFTVEVPGMDEEDIAAVTLTELEEVTDTDPLISLNALTGNQNFSIMRVKVTTMGKTLQVLIDLGSTHNFLDIHIADSIGCKSETIPDMAVTVADGNQLRCASMCKGFTWMLGGQLFTADVLLIPLGSCDMVLGVQWLSTLGSISWNFKQMTMRFSVHNDWVELKGIPSKRLKVSDKGLPDKFLNEAAQVCLIQVSQLSGEVPPGLVHVSGTEAGHCSELVQMKVTYADVFEDPSELPPLRGVMHLLWLREESAPAPMTPAAILDTKLDSDNIEHFLVHWKDTPAH
uniref:Retrotransposon gag domain-containing protein n=1 Tax=Chenopodium quinoa TaxID=63459 RepID=A0A803MRK9_CHEQI